MRSFLLSQWALYLAISVIIVFGYVATYQEKFSYTDSRNLRYSFTVENPSNHAVRRASMWAYIPVKQTSTQKRISIKSSHPYKLEKDASGSERVFFILGTMPPRSSKVVTVNVSLATSYTVAPSNIDKPDAYLRAGKFIEVDEGIVSSQAERLSARSAEITARNIYEWVSNNIEYSGYLSSDMGAAYAIKKRRGDCSEYSYLVTALARSAGIPARVLAGFEVSGNTLLKPADYHNWSQLYFDGAWHNVDALRKKFDKDVGDFIAFRVLADVANDNPVGGSQTLFGSTDPVSIRMTSM